MIKFLDSIPKEDLNGKKVLLRVDFNVPVPTLNLSLTSSAFGKVPSSSAGGATQIKIANDFKIKSHLETITYLLKNGSKILLVSHHDSLESFLPIVEDISAILGETISLVPHSEFFSVDLLFQTSPVFLLDNIRQDPREEKNDETLAKEFSKGFDFFINDAFAVSHRNHALVTSITKFLSSYAGFLIKKEIANLSQAIEAESKGKVLVLGGAKISTKLPVIQNFFDKAEKILIGGGLANDFWQARGVKMGASLVDDSVWLNIESDKIILPSDILVSKGWTLEKVKEVISHDGWLDHHSAGLAFLVRDLEADEAILDMGPQSAKDFSEIIKAAELVIWNGPFGLFEFGEFASGTKVIAKAVAEVKKSVVGGGDTIIAAAKLGLLNKFSYVSTGGGAMLEFLAGNRLPGLEALGYYN